MLNNPSTPRRSIARVVNGGRPAVKLYLFIRLRYSEAYTLFYSDERRSLRQVAARMKVDMTTFKRALGFIDQFQQSLSKGDFDPLEKALFSEFGDYKVLPFWKVVTDALERTKGGGGAGAPADSVSANQRKKPGPKPGSKRKPRQNGSDSTQLPSFAGSSNAVGSPANPSPMPVVAAPPTSTPTLPAPDKTPASAPPAEYSGSDELELTPPPAAAALRSLNDANKKQTS